MSLATALSCQGVKTSQDADATTSADNQGYTSIKGKKAFPNTQTEPPELLLPLITSFTITKKSPAPFFHFFCVFPIGSCRLLLTHPFTCLIEPSPSARPLQASHLSPWTCPQPSSPVKLGSDRYVSTGLDLALCFTAQNPLPYRQPSKNYPRPPPNVAQGPPTSSMTAALRHPSEAAIK